MLACCKTPSELGDIPSNVRVGECPKRKISGFKGAASGEPGKNLVENNENGGLHFQNDSETVTNRSEIKFLIDLVLQKF